MPSLSDVKVTITTEGNTEGVDKVEKAINQLSGDTEKNVSGLSAKTAAIMGVVAGAAQTLAQDAIGMIEATVGDAIKRVDTLNNSGKVFSNLGFKADDVSAAMTALDKSIRGLPTSLDQAVGGMESLALQNGNITEARKEFTAMNDAVLSSGRSTAALENAVMQITQLDMNGPLDAQTWNSLKQSGLEPAMKAMADMSGISMAKLKDEFGDGTLKVSDFMAKLQELDKNGTGNMASLSKQAKDMTGGIGTGIANAKTAITRGMADILTAIGTTTISTDIASFGSGFEKLAKTVAKDIPEVISKIKDLDNQIGKYLGPSFHDLWDTIDKKVFPVLERLWKEIIEPLIPIFGGALMLAIKATVNVLNDLFKIIVPTLNFMLDHKGSVEALAFAFGTLAIAMKLDSMFNAITMGFWTMRLITIPSVITSFEALEAAVTAPIVMPALMVAAALASIVLVVNAINDARHAWDNAQAAADSANRSMDAAMQKEKDLAKNGTPAQQAAAKKALAAGYASGTDNAEPGWHWVGENGPELLNFNGGEKVIPAEQSAKLTTGGGNTVVTAKFYGDIKLGDESAVTAFFKKLDQDTLLAGRGLTPNRGLR